MRDAIIKKLKELGYNPINADFYKKIDDWKSWYQGDVKHFHRYRVRNGDKLVTCKRYTLGMAKKVCENWADLMMNEKVSITLEGEREQAFVDEIFTNNNFAVKINEMQELKSALGTVAYVPRVVNQQRGTARVELDYVTVEHIFPLSWRNGIVNECAFTSVVYCGDKKYLYLQLHKKVNGLYDVENRIFEVINDTLTERPLASVESFENIPAVVHTGSDKRQFIIDRLNIANNFDYELPLGVAVYANAIDVLQGVDIAYDSYVNEFLLGKKRIMVAPSASQYMDGEPVFDADDVVFYVLPEEMGDGNTIKEIDMTLRTAEHNTGIQDQLNMLSSKCGLGEAYYRFDRNSVATATQVISEQSAMFRTLKKHEILLESALVELCRILLRLGNAAIGAGLDEDVEISIDFDDSIIEDKQAEFNRDQQMLSAGIMNDWEARAKWFNEDEETAKAALPKVQDMGLEEEQEVE